MMTTFLLLVLGCCCLAPLANAHGYLASPRSRNLLASENLGFNCPHCLNFGGVETVSNQRTLSWPKGLRTLSGDPISSPMPRDFEAGGAFYVAGTIGGNYTSGGVMPIQIVTTTNHNGRFSFRICKVSGGYDTAARVEAKELTQACFDQNVLLQADVKGSQMPGERYFYTLPKDAGKSTEYEMFYRLPDDLECDGVESHCILQWHWLTFNSCQTSDAPVKYIRSQNNMANCDDAGASYPEEFSNLADVLILQGTPTNGSQLQLAFVALLATILLSFAY